MAVLKVTVRVLVKGVQASLDQATTKVTRGKQVELTLTVKNTGQGSDTFTIVFSGPAAEWASAESMLLNLGEGENRSVIITIAPPKGADAGIAILNVTVLSTEVDFLDRAQIEVKVEKAKESPGLEATTLLAATAVAAPGRGRHAPEESLGEA